MKDSTRRLLLFLVIVVAGSFMILVDIPVFYLLAGVIVLGILLLFLTGAVKLPKRKSKAEGKKKVKPGKKEKEKVKSAKKRGRKTSAEPVDNQSKKGISEFFSTLAGAFSVIGRDLRSASRSPKEKEAKQKKIDEMLDKSVVGAEEVSLDDIVPDIAPVQKKKGVDDPFSELAQDSIKIDQMEDIETDLDIPLFDDEDLDAEAFGIEGDMPSGGTDDFSKMDINLAEDEAPIAIDEEEDEEVEDILKAHQDILDGSGEGEEAISLDEDIGDFSDIDLDSVEMGEETGGSDEKVQASPAPAPAPAPGTDPAVPVTGGMKKADLVMPDQDEMIAFGTGSRQDDDLMASLKSDAKAVKKQENLSLLRDLKDVRVPASDLEKELEGLLKISRRKE